MKSLFALALVFSWPAGSTYALQAAATQGNRGSVEAASEPRNEVVRSRRAGDPDAARQNRGIDAMERERRELERQLQELDGGSGAASGNTVGTANFDPVSPITDPIEDALGPVGSEIADSMESIEEGLSDLFGSSSDEERRPPVVDHREGRTPPRRNETVPARRAALPAPSGLAILADTGTSLIIHWQDNANSEFGVQVERGTPVSNRGGTNYGWQRVFNSEERVESRVRGTGPRSDIDDGLTRGNRYCYRLRAYRGQQVSEYSEIACANLR